MPRRLKILIRGVLVFKDWHFWIADRFKLLKKDVPRLFRLRNGIAFIFVQEGEIEQGFGSFQEIFVEEAYNKHYKIKKDDTVLDIGSGIGEYLVYAAKCGAKVTGYEALEKRFLFSKTNLLINKCGGEVFNKHIISLDDVAAADFLKMDIEGGEFEIAKNTKDFKRFKNITMEFHYSPRPLEEKLKSQGFEVKTEYTGENCGYLYASRK